MVVAALLNAGASVRVLTRNRSAALRTLGGGVAIVEGEITDPRAVQKALIGVRRCVCALSAFSPSLVRRAREIELTGLRNLLEQGRRMSLDRLVYISVYEPRREIIERYRFEAGRIKLEAEQIIAESRMNWTVLGAAFSMEIFKRMIHGPVMIVPGGGRRPIPAVSPADVGFIAARAVLRDDLAELRCRIPGPEAITFPEACGRIARSLQRRILYRPVPYLPLRVAATVSRPIQPFLANLLPAIKLLNAFPQEVVEQLPRDLEYLQETFGYQPLRLEEELRRPGGRLP
jgi:uncharacterized protein YbjT (DUF2867 family)